ncbi:hypothetical protein FACS189481_5090 [Clostridia bacterium]|nr:hypothetical protein FACS189481_5090 [Clostridia bacterium]
MQNNNGFLKFKNWPLWILLGLLVVVALHFAIGPKFDTQITGGSLVRYSYDTKYIKIDVDLTKIKKTSDITTGTKGFSGLLLNSEKLKQLVDGLTKEVSTNKIAPVIGQEFLKRCLVAASLILLVAFVYIAVQFRKIGSFKTAFVATFVTIFDVSIVYGLYLILRAPVGLNFVLFVVATIGYSLYCTSVIFGQIRENLPSLQASQKGKVSVEEEAAAYDKYVKAARKLAIKTLLLVLCLGVELVVVAFCFGVAGTTIMTLVFIGCCVFYSCPCSSVFVAIPLWALCVEIKWEKQRKNEQDGQEENSKKQTVKLEF